MDRHLIDAFIESLTDILADKVAQRLGLKPPVKAVERALTTTPEIPNEVPASLPELLTPPEAAALLRTTVSGLEGMRAKGTGPKFIKVGGRIRYRRSDLV